MKSQEEVEAMMGRFEVACGGEDYTMTESEEAIQDVLLWFAGHRTDDEVASWFEEA